MEQVTIDPVGDEITAAAMADILAPLDSAASIEATPGTLGETAPPTVPGSVGHGRIRLRIRRISTPETAEQATAEPVVVREIVGHGTVRLRERTGEPAGVNVDVDISDRPLPGDVVGHGEVLLRQSSDDEPAVVDLTDAARADIMEAIEATS
jgi:hypothetical protein